MERILGDLDLYRDVPQVLPGCSCAWMWLQVFFRVSGTELGGHPWSWHMGTTSSIPRLEFWEHAWKAAGFDGRQVVLITLHLKRQKMRDLGEKKFPLTSPQSPVAAPR